jgi:hypothetical protein
LIRRADQTIDTEQIAEHWDRMGQLYASTHRRNVSQLGGTPRDLEATALVLQTVLDLLDEEGFAHLASRQANSAADSISTS